MINEDITKDLITIKVLLKLIVKKIYNLNDSQYEKAMKRMEEDSKVSVEQYLNGVGSRSEQNDI